MSDLPLCWVGFDTSNYTTSVAVCTAGENGAPTVIANLKAPLPVAAGARGLRQSDAVFAHVKNLPELTAHLRDVLREGGYRVAAVGYSAKPRDVEDSYMPCFLVGRAAAESFAAGSKAAIYPFSHQSGHITAALYSAGILDVQGLPDKPFLAFHVSGGTTEAVVAHPHVGGFSVELVGGSADLHAGQVIDRVGVLMGLDFPCGRAMEALAETYIAMGGDVKSLSVMRLSVKDGMCNLSGLENRAEQLWEATRDAGAVSAFVLTFIGKTLRKMTEQIQEAHTPFLPIIYAGGVMSNKFIRPLLTDGTIWPVYFSEPAFSADNAAGVAILTMQKFVYKN